MNATVQLVIVAAVVVAAGAFVVARIVRTIRGRQPSCCSDSDVDPAVAPWLSPCEGCSGCAGHGQRS